MLALASIMLSFAAIVCLYYQAPERGQPGRFPQSLAGRKALRLAAVAGLSAGFWLAVVALGWAAGIGLWLAALMVTGVAVVSLAGNHAALTQRLGFCSAVGGLAVTMAQWAVG